jgi:hypothetical protein
MAFDVADIRGAYRAFAYGGIHGFGAVIAYQLASNNRVVELGISFKPEMANLLTINDLKPFHDRSVMPSFQVSSNTRGTSK